MLAEFRKFLMEKNALALAIGVIIGAAVGKVVGSLVSDVLMPVISLGIPGGQWREAKIPLTDNSAIAIGPFIGSVVDFVIVAGAVFLITKALVRPEPAKPSRVCDECKESVAPDARRCKFCTSVLAPAGAVAK